MPQVTTARRLRAPTPDRRVLEQAADWLAVAVAVSLPWSTSATSILIALWLAAIAPTLDVAAIRREVASAAGGLPILLWGLGALGMLWADVAWSERWGGLSGFNKLLVIPLLLAQFRRSEHGMRVLAGFFWSVSGLLLLSWALTLIPGLPWRGRFAGFPGIPVKDYIVQSEDFLICALVLLEIAFERGRARAWRPAAGLVAFAALFLANIAFVATGRTTLLVAPALVLMLGWRQAGWKGLIGAGLLAGIVGAAVSLGSPYLRAQLERSISEFQSYRASDKLTSTGLHLEFVRKSISFVETAPVIGHGTGSIPEQFRNAAAATGDGASSVVSVNPHDQILAVAIQLGLVGAAVLAAMWAAHLMLFRGGGLVAWTGIVLVANNIIASLVNSHLFDFTQGWIYVFGVGVAGGMMLRQRDTAAAMAKG